MDEDLSPSPGSTGAGTVLITGGARRLGAAMGLELARAGWDVVVHFRSSGDEAERVCEQIRTLGRGAWTLEADLGSPAECEALVPRAAELSGGLQALICNASIFPTSTIFDVTPEQIQESVQLHAVAPTQLAQAMWKQDEARHILHLLDSKITGPDEEHLAYHLSKRMLSDLTRVMARAFAPRIAVNAIAPGPVLPAICSEPAQFAGLASGIPLQKTGEPQDIALAARYLLGSQFVTGQTLYVDGGRHLDGDLYG